MRGNEDDDSEREMDSPDLLDDPRRRYLLYCLYLYANPIQLSDIAYQVTVWQEDEQCDDVVREIYRTYTSLYHDHLPELTTAGLVEYDRQEDMVELDSDQTGVEDALERYLSREIDTLLAAEGDTLEDDLSGRTV